MIIVAQLNVDEHPLGVKRAGSRETDINANVIIASYEGREKRRRGGNEKHGEPRE